MKKNDLRAGVLYGFQRGEYGSLEPMLLLDADRLYGFNRAHPFPTVVDLKVVRPSDETRPSTDRIRYRQHGYLMATPLTPREYEERKITPVKARNLATVVDLQQALDLTIAQRHQVPYSLTLVNPRNLVGPYEHVLAQRQADRQQREIAEARRRAAEQELRSRANAVRTALEGYGITGTEVRTTSFDAHLTVRLDQAEKLVKLLDR